MSKRLALTLAIVGLSVGTSAQVARAASWHLDSSFGAHGVAVLPLREVGGDSRYPVGPGDKGSLLALGPRGSLFVGGYARTKGSFLVARLSAQGRLVTSFGNHGLTAVPGIYSSPKDPPRMFALPGGKLLVVGLDRVDHFMATRLTDAGQADGSFGHHGVAQYKLPHIHTGALVVAATVEPDGDILASYQREARQPTNEPMIAPGLGEGPMTSIGLVSSGALDRSFGRGGFLDVVGRPPELVGYSGTGQGWACEVTIDSGGSILRSYEQAVPPSSDDTEVPAVQELDAAGADAPGFGSEGVSFLPFTPKFQGEESSICDGLFALPGGAVEAGFGGAGADSAMVNLFRFTSTGAPDLAFGTSGHAIVDLPARAFVVGPNAETFSAGTSRTALVLGGTLASGVPDPALGGSRGVRLAIDLPSTRPDEEPQAFELLAGGESLSILVGERVVRVVR